MNQSPRLFTTDREIEVIGQGLLDKSLPKQMWTHEAHFAATVYLLKRQPELDLEQNLPAIIYAYNEASGGKNTGTSGYHETLTQFYIKLIRSYVLRDNRGLALKDLCNKLILSPQAHRDFPLQYYSGDLLFSTNARKEWVEPNLKDLDFL